MKKAAIFSLFCISLLFSPKISHAYSHGNVIYHGNRNDKKIALTFDADMTPHMKQELDSGMVASWYNKKVIDVLDKTRTKATFFLTGMWIELYKKEAEQLAQNPLFELGNHSYSHPSFHNKCYGLRVIRDKNEKKVEIEKTQKLLENLTHQKNKWFRFPGGCFGDRDVTLVQNMGLKVVQWDVVSKDAFSHNTDSIINRVINKSQKGSIVVMHLNGGRNAPLTGNALPKIITELKKRGYEFVTLSDLTL